MGTDFRRAACGAVLNAINTRLDAETVAYNLAHGSARVVIRDSQFMPMLASALESMDGPTPTVIWAPMISSGSMPFPGP